MKHTPAISVVMPVHNGASYIREAIDSILIQTMPDFELIIVNDGSTDESGTIARSYADRRISVIDFPVNKGCYPARNAGMRQAKGKYICVMDSDDVCKKHRLEVQYNFLENHPEVGLIGGAYQPMNVYYTIFREKDHETIKLMLMRFCYLRHPTCMARTSLIEKHNLYYDERYIYAADYDWQVKAASLFAVSNVNESVLLYRSHDQQITTSKSNEQAVFADRIRLHQLSFLGIEPTEDEQRLHLNFIKGRLWGSIDMTYQWMERLLEANRKYQYYNPPLFRDFLEATQLSITKAVNEHE